MSLVVVPSYSGLSFRFARPFLARNPSDLWQRWHITLSTWVRDYMFMPFGRGRKGRHVFKSRHTSAHFWR